MNNMVKWGLGIGILVLLLWGNAYATAREIAIISSKDYPSNTITADKVKEVYLGEKMSEGSVKIKPMEHNDEAIKKKFIENVLGTSIDRYKAYWIKKFFQEGITPPTNKVSSSELIHAVSQTSGGIGYVWADEVKGDTGFKVLLRVEVGD